MAKIADRDEKERSSGDIRRACRTGLNGRKWWKADIVVSCQIMGRIHRTVASIGFYGDDLDPSEITALLGIPTVGVKMGERWHTALGIEKVSRTGSWRLSADDQEPGDLDYQINHLLDQLSDDLPSWRAFAERFRGRAFCGLFLNETNEGLSLKPTTLARLGERGLLLDLDIYGQDLPD